MSTQIENLKVTVAICTRLRPKMLTNLLESIVLLDPVPSVDLHIVIVENGPEVVSESVVGTFKAKLSVQHVHEPRIGIVRARNTAIEKSLETGADWIGFVDDDEIVDNAWLVRMVDAMHAYPKVRAFAGPVFVRLPDSATKWFPAPRIPRAKDGEKVFGIGAGNILFHRDVFAKDRYWFRFDLRFNLTGGEDAHLFESMQRKSINIIWVREAICSEDMLPERATLSSRMKRDMRYGQNAGAMNRLRYGPFPGSGLNALYGFKMLLHALAYMMASSIVVAFSREKMQNYIGIVLQKISRSAGYIHAIYATPADVYATVDGH